MAEGSKLYGIVFTLGLVSAFIVLMYSETGVTGGPPGIGTITYPTFANPFAPKPWTFVPRSEGTNTSVNPRGSAHDVCADEPTVDCTLYGYPSDDVPDCSTGFTNSGGTTWGCVNSPDGLLSYITLQNTAISYRGSENLSAFPIGGTWRIITVSIRLLCDSTTPTDANGPTTQISFSDGGGTFLSTVSTGDVHFDKHGFACPNAMANVTISGDVTLAGISPARMGGSEINFDYTELGGATLAHVSDVAVTITYQRESGCVFIPSGNPWDDVSRATYYVGCVFLALGQFFLDGFAYLINAAIFVFDWILVLGDVVIKLVAVIAWLYAIPGMPVEIQGFIDVWLTANAVMLIYIIVKTLRGSE